MHKPRMRLPSDKLVRAAQFKVPANSSKLDCRTPDIQFAALKSNLERIDMRLEVARKTGNTEARTKLLDLRCKTIANLQRVGVELVKWQEKAQDLSSRYHNG